MEAPKKIWYEKGSYPSATDVESDKTHHDTQYIRADLVQRLKGCAILQEAHRRADKMGVEDNGLDFTVRISAEDYRGLTELLKEIDDGL